jgi:hypothetical protein
MVLFLVNLVAVAGSLSGKIFLSRWLVAWCLVLAAFGVESVTHRCAVYGTFSAYNVITGVLEFSNVLDFFICCVI